MNGTPLSPARLLSRPPRVGVIDRRHAAAVSSTLRMTSMLHWKKVAKPLTDGAMM
jgi:hypothetical protein